MFPNPDYLLIMLSKFLKNIWKVQFYLYFYGILPKNYLDGIPRMKNFYFSEKMMRMWLSHSTNSTEIFKNDPTIKTENSHFFSTARDSFRHIRRMRKRIRIASIQYPVSTDRDHFNRSSRRKPTFHKTRLFLHFPNELCYGYLRFEGNGKIPLGR